MARKRISQRERKRRKKQNKKDHKKVMFGAHVGGKMVEFSDDDDAEFWDGFWQEAEKSVDKSDE